MDIRDTPVSDSDIQCFNITTTLRELYIECPQHLREPKFVDSNKDSTDDDDSSDDDDDTTNSDNKVKNSDDTESILPTDEESNRENSEISDAEEDEEKPDDVGQTDGAAGSTSQNHFIHVYLRDGNLVNVNNERVLRNDYQMREIHGIRYMVGVLNGGGPEEVLQRQLQAREDEQAEVAAGPSNQEQPMAQEAAAGSSDQNGSNKIPPIEQKQKSSPGSSEAAGSANQNTPSPGISEASGSLNQNIPKQFEVAGPSNQDIQGRSAGHNANQKPLPISITIRRQNAPVPSYLLPVSNAPAASASLASDAPQGNMITIRAIAPYRRQSMPESNQPTASSSKSDDVPQGGNMIRIRAVPPKQLTPESNTPAASSAKADDVPQGQNMIRISAVPPKQLTPESNPPAASSDRADNIPQVNEAVHPAENASNNNNEPQPAAAAEELNNQQQLIIVHQRRPGEGENANQNVFRNR